MRRGTTHLAVQPLWVQRLGLIMLPRVRVNGAWLCTVCGSRPGDLADVVDLHHLRAGDSGAGACERLPVGVFAIEDLELQTAFDPLAAAALAGEDFIDAWRVQAADQVRSNTFAQGLADFTDPTTLCVAVDRDSWAGVREQLARRGGSRLSSRTGTAPAPTWDSATVACDCGTRGSCATTIPPSASSSCPRHDGCVPELSSGSGGIRRSRARHQAPRSRPMYSPHSSKARVWGCRSPRLC